jgi:hypothetical protein
MKINNPGEVLTCTVFATITTGAGRDMLPLSQPIAHTLFAFALLFALMAIEATLDWPVIGRLGEIAYARRARREAAQREADAATRQAAFEEGLARTKAYAATLRR